MYSTYKQIFKQVNDIMQDPLINEFLSVKQIEDNLPDRKNIIKFGLILKQLDQFVKEQLIIEQKIKGKLLAIIKYDKSFPKFVNFIQIINNEYTIEFSQQHLDELNHITDSHSDDLYTLQDIIYEVVKRIKTRVNVDHLKYLLDQQIQHPISTKLYQINQPPTLIYLLQHNERIIFILIAVCNQEQIPLPCFINCLYLTGDQMKLRIDQNLERTILSIVQVKKVAEELGYNNVQLAEQGLLELKLQYYKQYLEIPEQDLIDSTLSVLVMKGIEVNQNQIRNLLTQTSKVQNSPQINRLKTLFNQLLETSQQMTEKRQQNRNHKVNIVIVLKEVISKMVKDKTGFPQIINLMKLRNGNLKFDTTDTILRKYFQYIQKPLVELFSVTSFTQLNNFCRTSILNQTAQCEAEIIEKMLELVYQERSKYLLDLKNIFEESKQTSNSLLMILSICQEKSIKPLEKTEKSEILYQIKVLIEQLLQYTEKNKIIDLDSDEELKKQTKV
ncbi:unnamed protein product [Paramecium sonneborni]|uniref:Uncharacterized protein n=1 Tax=Paramecium sonneborni TaxID=65129 RepID=A0A8S1KGM7_9CILI|nr:unnamed protein product [Paramecium sonneborni]